MWRTLLKKTFHARYSVIFLTVNFDSFSRKYAKQLDGIVIKRVFLRPNKPKKDIAYLLISVYSVYMGNKRINQYVYIIMNMMYDNV